jgi:hypothetical protein
MILAICQSCKKFFKTYPCRVARFCSHSCYSEALKSRSISNETRLKLSTSAKARGFGKDRKGKPSYNKGLKMPQMSGEKHPRWIVDRSKLSRVIQGSDRSSYIYADWRKQVFTRDGYKCKIQNEDCCGKIEAHHILGWKSHPELRYVVQNGITLCHAHHPRKRKEETKMSPYFQNLVAQTNLCK